jgi:hypothetical protein
LAAVVARARRGAGSCLTRVVGGVAGQLLVAGVGPRARVEAAVRAHSHGRRRLKLPAAGARAPSRSTTASALSISATSGIEISSPSVSFPCSLPPLTLVNSP